MFFPLFSQKNHGNVVYLDFGAGKTETPVLKFPTKKVIIMAVRGLFAKGERSRPNSDAKVALRTPRASLFVLGALSK